MKTLSQKRCSPSKDFTEALSKNDALKLLEEILPRKISEDARRIYREYIRKDFMDAIYLINDVARIAELENHHPDIHLTDYKNVRIELSTHDLKGLSENDFIIAAKIKRNHLIFFKTQRLVAHKL